MRKQIATISILVLFLVFSGSSVKVSAGGGTCSIPSCRPRTQVVSPKDASRASDRDAGAHITESGAEQDNALNLILLAVGWAITFHYFK